MKEKELGARRVERSEFVTRVREALNERGTGGWHVHTSMAHQDTSEAQMTELDALLGGYEVVEGMAWILGWEKFSAVD